MTVSSCIGVFHAGEEIWGWLLPISAPQARLQEDIIPTLFCIKTVIYLQIAFQFLVPKMPEEAI